MYWTRTAAGNAAFSRMEARFGGFQKHVSALKQAGHSYRSNSPWHEEVLQALSDAVCPKKFSCFSLPLFFNFLLFFNSSVISRSFYVYIVAL